MPMLDTITRIQLTLRKKVIQTYKGMIGDFDAFLGGLPTEQQARFRELYSI